MAASAGLCVQYGCGLSAPEGWLNFDASPTLRMQRLPAIGAVAPGVKFPAAVRYGDVVSGLPVASGSADAAYCSHVLEHLSFSDCKRALKETLRILKPGGVFRMVLPDLAVLVGNYNAAAGDAEAANRFMRNTLLGVESRPRGLKGLMRSWLGNAEHLWMWDYPSLSAELAAAGFTGIRRAVFGDSGLEVFAKVEAENRWENGLGIHCVKPGA